MNIKLEYFYNKLRELKGLLNRYISLVSFLVVPNGNKGRGIFQKIPSVRNALFIFMFLPVHVFADINLTFGVYTADKPTEVVRKFRPILNTLENSMNLYLDETVVIRTRVFSDYQDTIDAIINGNVDFSRIGPVSYVEVKDRSPDIQIVAMESKKGKKTFKGVICVHNDSTISTIENLRGKRFAFGNELSTIGRYLSQNYLVTYGVKASDLLSYEYLGRHDKVGYAVGSGKFDAGALKESTFKKLKAEGVPIKSIADFQNVTKPWVVRKGLNDRIVTAMRTSLLAIKDPVVLNLLKKDGFTGGSDSDYEVTRKSIEMNKSFFR